MRFKFTVEVSGEIEIGDITDADVFRDLRECRDWRELIHDDKSFSDAERDRAVLAALRNHPNILTRLVEGFALRKAEDAVFQMDGSGRYYSSCEILSELLPYLPPDVAEAIRGRPADSGVLDLLWHLREAVRVGKATSEVRTAQSLDPKSCVAANQTLGASENA